MSSASSGSRSKSNHTLSQTSGWKQSCSHKAPPPSLCCVTQCNASEETQPNMKARVGSSVGCSICLVVVISTSQLNKVALRPRIIHSIPAKHWWTQLLTTDTTLEEEDRKQGHEKAQTATEIQKVDFRRRSTACYYSAATPFVIRLCQLVPESNAKPWTWDIILDGFGFIKHGRFYTKKVIGFCRFMKAHLPMATLAIGLFTTASKNAFQWSHSSYKLHLITQVFLVYICLCSTYRGTIMFIFWMCISCLDQAVLKDTSKWLH